MAFIKLDREKLKHNYNYLQNLFESKNIQWGVVSKILCGNTLFIKEVLNLGVKEIHDSRISNLKTIKELNGDIQTVYIKPPAKRSISRIVKYADVSFNTELDTIKMLSKEAVLQGRVHKIVIMIEMGDLREGVMGNDLLFFYENVLRLDNIEISGIGTNLNCLSGVMPNQDKLIQLSLYKQLIEVKFNIQIPWVSGGTSVAIPLILKNIRPMAVNHFRVGEALFFANDLFTGEIIQGMQSDVFTLFAEIIEITEKPNVPSGELGQNVAGNTFDIDQEHDLGASSLRAILDIGLLDMQMKYIEPEDNLIKMIDASSDMLVVDITNCENRYKIGDLISFKTQYMGVLYLLNSNYIEKIVG